MKKNRKIFLKNISLIILVNILLLGGFFIAFDIGAFKSFASTKLDENLLNTLTTPIEIYDKDSNLISENIYIKDLVNIDEIKDYTINAFICTEDKDFYKHKGINYKSIIRAILSNIKNGSYKQGASTISQQLIKNTHLDNKKTLSRKINEALLTQQLESKYSKKEILQSYLNAIYFGKGTFGIEKASKKYFSKSAKDLTLNESATLAGLIKSPKYYSPIDNYENCKQRRNVVLNNMFLANKITKEQLNSEQSKEILLNTSDTDLGENNYNAVAIKQASKILNMREQDIINGGYKIYTNQDTNLQKELSKILKTSTNSYDKLLTVIDSKTGAVLAYLGNSNYNLFNKKMQPGSVFKPIAVYAPAIENNIITTSTIISDEELNINGYKPKNFDNKYHGNVSVKTALANSYNIPAVKVLEYLGIKNSKTFVKKFGIDISQDNGYSIALGGLSQGVNFLDIASSYTTFANNGIMSKAYFIKKIENKYGRTIHTSKSTSKQIISEDTACLMTDMLKESVNSGTAKKLKNKYNNIASKTGTAGTKNGNSDTWNIAYSPKYTSAVWVGNNKNMLPQNYTGGGEPTLLASKIFSYLDDKTNFNEPKTIQKKYISTIDLDEDCLVKLVSNDTPDRYKKLAYFSSKNLPKETSKKLDVPVTPVLTMTIKEDKLILKFNAKKYIDYEIYKKCDKNSDQLVASVSEKSGLQSIIIDIIPDDHMVEYYLKYKISGDFSPRIYKTEPIKIITKKEYSWE